MKGSCGPSYRGNDIPPYLITLENTTMAGSTVSGQNTIGIYITLLVLIQPTDVEQNAVNNNWLLKLQPAVKLQSWQKSNFHQIE